MWIKSLFLIVILTASVIGSSMAFFSDSEISTNNNIVAGAIDLLVNGQNNPEGLVNLEDMKPGDVNKWLEVSTNPANVYLHITDLIPGPGGVPTEPEEEEENELGGPKHDLENYIGYALQRANGEEIIATSSSTLLAQASSCYIPLGVVNPGIAVTIQQIFSLPSDVTNWAQGDTLTFTEVFFAQQTRHNPIDPVTNSGRIWNSENQRCELCSFDAQLWASEASDYDLKLTKDGGSVLVERTNLNNALGMNDTNNPPTNNNFIALGFGGSIVLKFPQPIQDGVGADLRIYEVTGGRNTYPLETAKVEVSFDDVNWYGNFTATSEPGGDGINEIDVDGALNEFQYVRITDTSNPSLFPNNADGFDIDAVQALYGKSCES